MGRDSFSSFGFSHVFPFSEGKYFVPRRDKRIDRLSFFVFEDSEQLVDSR